MSVEINDGKIVIRKFTEADFSDIKKLFVSESWMTPVYREHEAFEAWKSSPIALIAACEGRVVGAARALTDGTITTYLAEIVVDKEYRGRKIGKVLIDACHDMYPSTRMDLLSTEESVEFYKSNGFREGTGFRKSRWDE